MRSQVPILALAVASVVAFLVGGIESRRYVASAFDATRQYATIRALAERTLNAQLDEETGIRGYAATGAPLFLEPYHSGLQRFGPTVERLRALLDASPISPVTASLDDAVALNRRWLGEVAGPLLRAPLRSNTLRLERKGKMLIDELREDIASIDSAGEERATAVAADTRGAIDRINLLVAFAAVALVVIMFAYGTLQAQSDRRIARQDREAEAARREQAQLLAAYSVEKRISDTLQQAFTQRPLPVIETLQFSASYVPAAEDAKVGGDWYDAMALGEKRVLFAIGDVTGHGIEAAVTMNSARQALLAAALRDPDPGAVLAHVNTDLLTRETRLVTGIVGLADSAAYEFVYSVAGHPPPVLLEPGRAPRMLECGSLPLGAAAGTTYAVNRVQSVPGAVLVLYTDGAVEHSRNVLEGERMLLAAVEGARSRSETDAAAAIHGAIFAGRAVGDDVAILTIGFSTGPAAGVVVSGDRAQSSFTSRLEVAAPGPGEASARAARVWGLAS